MIREWYFKLDIPHLIVLIITAITMAITSTIRPDPLYIPPNDSNSMFPHPGKSTIPTWLVIVMVLAVGIFTIILLYLISLWYPKIVARFSILAVLWNFGITLTISTTIGNVMKNYVGRARPDMYALCGPNVTGDHNSCPGVKQSDFDDNYRSFPSGHSSSAMAGFLFIALIIQRALIWSKAVSTLLFGMLFLLALYVGATRIRDFKHHTDDVLAGFLIGSCIANFVWSQCKEYAFNLPEQVKSEPDNEDDSPKSDDKAYP